MNRLYFIWKGESSLNKNIKVKRLPDEEKPEANINKIIIPGRSGFLTEDEGTYKEILKTVECSVENGNIDDLCNWLNGSSEVIFSNKPDRKYKATIINKIPFSKVLRSKINRFIIQFDCQPYAYDTSSNQITLVNPTEIYNYGTKESEPIFKIYGSGNITLIINNKNIYLYNVNQSLTVDSELMDCYSGELLLNNDMLGDFPVLVPGVNSISWTGNITKIEITPNWRFL